jgi:ABC-type cobalamin transport system permease subunit
MHMSEDQLETLIIQTINGAVATIPSYLEEIKENNEIFKVDNPKEFVYGIVMGMALGMSGAIMSAQKEMPTAEDQIKVRDIIYKHIPEIRERIFNG